MKNRRLFFGGGTILVIAIALFVGLSFIAGKSNDPVKVMGIAGEFCGAIAGLAIALMIAAFFVAPARRRP